MIVRDRPPLRQSIEIVDPSGRRSRWAEDAPRPADALQELSYASVAPGGFSTLDCKLVRDVAVGYGDTAPFATVRVRSASGGIDWEGRLERAARTSGREVAASPSAVGYQAALEDDNSVVALYSTLALSGHTSITAEREADMLALGIRHEAPQLVVQRDDGQAIRTQLTGEWDSPLRSETLFQSPVPIGGVTALWRRPANILSSDANWDYKIQLGNDSRYTVAADVTANLLSGASSGTVALAATTATRKVAGLYLHYGGSGTSVGGRGEVYALDWSLVAVWGIWAFGLAGTANRTGLNASEIIANQIEEHDPTWRTAITPTTYDIADAAFFEPTTRAAIIKNVNRFHAYDWFVWEGPLFEYRPRTEPRRRWRSRVGLAQLEETGQAADKLWRSVVVSYKDPDGSTKTVGPPDSGAQTIDASLMNNELDIPSSRMYHLALDLAASTAAIQAGQRFLFEANQVDRSGKAIQVGYVENADTGLLHAASDIRAGDAIMYSDASDTSFRRIANVQWDRPSRTASLDLDSPAESLQAVVERLNASVADLGT